MLDIALQDHAVTTAQFDRLAFHIRSELKRTSFWLMYYFIRHNHGYRKVNSVRSIPLVRLDREAVCEILESIRTASR